jgi:putative glycosyltransferase (TIGR04372 family)
MLQRLIYISKFKYYKNHKLNFEDKKIIFTNKNNLNYSFIRKFIRYTNFTNNNATQCELVKLRKKYGNFNYNTNKYFSFDVKNKLLKKLGINKKFICLFIKPYDQSYRKLNLNKEHDPRCLNDIETLADSIKFLINNNFDVVLVGRSGVNIFNEIGVINYSSMNLRSVLNDLLLYSSCEFMIGSPGGPVVYPFIFDKPCLGLNAFTLYAYNDWEKYIYHPKPILDIKNNRMLSLNEILKNPIFFEQGKKAYNERSLMTIDLSSAEVLSSVKDFFEMYKNNNYTKIT